MADASGTRTAHYLETLRQSCLTTAVRISDVAERRRLEQVAQVLCQLIVEARTLPELQAQALAAMQTLPPPLTVNADLAAGRARLQLLLRDSAPAALQDAGIRQLVDIEANTLRQFETAFRAIAAPAIAAGQLAQGQDGLPDAAALGRYLSVVLGGRVEVVKLDTLALGYSKLTLLVKLQKDGQPADDLIIRMDRPFNFLETTVIDEFPILQQLHAAGVRVPKSYALEGSGSVLGKPFIVQARAFGRNIGSHFMPPPRSALLCCRFAEQLAAIHAVPVARFGSGLRGASVDAEAQLRADIEKSYGHWRALDAVVPIVEAAFRWLREHLADGIGVRTLVHGDFSLSNLLISDQEEVAAVVDWEFAGLGNPAADLGWFFVGASRLEGWEFFLKAYQRAGGVLPDQRQLNFYILLGAVRLAVMNYQTSTGFESGQSSELKGAAVAAAFQREVTLRVSDALSELLARSS